MCAMSCSLYMPTQAVSQLQAFSALEKSLILKSNPVMKSCVNAFILQNKSQDDISDLGKDLMVDVFGGKSNDTLSPLSHIIFIKKAATAKAFVTLNGFSPLHLQQGSIANMCTLKLWYGLGWQMKWTQLNAWGRKKENQIVSIMTKKNAAPHELLRIIHCNC